ncbi:MULTISPECIES: GNAT family N-acetyltransferase [Grimontia]|uniref:Acetyltransferase (GNAT) family protein n=1 Tax=Grimontia marina TaxID=646534 RepID=A0A128EZC3_9GAMM|nr:MULTISPECIES: GNAT family N-acetyltransferase [Grimontia]WRV98885.1 GNAT family N-acetyltransferase [Grimontia sp. NTOU-MAR1]CZF79615.1 Acetyltransferase (GNAT) family protein [Grimontia marina]
MDISLRRASEEDIPFLLSLRDQTMRQYLEEVGMPTSAEEYEKRIRFEFSHAKIVELDGKPVGLFKATYTEELNYWYLVQIQISPEFQGLKIGSKLILNLIAKAATTKSKVGLSVIETNPAKQLYLRLGFEVVKRSGDELLLELQT